MTRFLLQFLFFLPLYSLFGQSGIDSHIKEIQTQNPEFSAMETFDMVYKMHLYSDRALAEQAVDSMSEIVLKYNRPADRGLLINRQASLLFVDGDYPNALELYNKSYNIYQEQNNEKELSGVLINIANCYGEMGQLELCLETHLKSLSIQERLNIKGNPLQAFGSY